MPLPTCSLPSTAKALAASLNFSFLIRLLGMDAPGLPGLPVASSSWAGLGKGLGLRPAWGCPWTLMGDLVGQGAPSRWAGPEARWHGTPGLCAELLELFGDTFVNRNL